MRGRTSLLLGDDPHGYELRHHPSNIATINAGLRHEQKCGGGTLDLMDDTPDGDVCCGFCCAGCDWEREFADIGRHRRK